MDDDCATRVDGRQKRDRADEREVIADKQCVLGRCE
jgi:hypothetical protein